MNFLFYWARALLLLRIKELKMDCYPWVLAEKETEI
jgi:hypothetical protein